jgi:hypothetical protein
LLNLDAIKMVYRDGMSVKVWYTGDLWVDNDFESEYDAKKSMEELEMAMRYDK